MKQLSVKTLTLIAIFSALAAILSLFDFNLPFFPPFIKLDFADLPALIATFAFGPLVGILIQIVRNAIHLFISNTGGIGELANMLVGCSLVGTVGFLYHYVTKKHYPYVALTCGIVTMSIVAMLANYYILLPLFSLFMPLEQILAFSAQFFPAVHDKYSFILYVILPFNLLKGSLITVCAYPLYKKLAPAFSRLLFLNL